jgi:hypothetical protein
MRVLCGMSRSSIRASNLRSHNYFPSRHLPRRMYKIALTGKTINLQICYLFVTVVTKIWMRPSYITMTGS